MAEVVVIHHGHDLKYTVVGSDCHQPAGWCHDILHMNTGGAFALDDYFCQVICT